MMAIIVVLMIFGFIQVISSVGLFIYSLFTDKPYTIDLVKYFTLVGLFFLVLKFLFEPKILLVNVNQGFVDILMYIHLLVVSPLIAYYNFYIIFKKYN